jgi:cytochrome c peroxidase
MSRLYFRNFRPSYIHRILVITLVPVLLASCSVEDEGASVIRVRGVATVLDLTGDPTTGRVLPAITDPKAQLGMKLFFSKSLGGNDDSACVTCHHPVLGGGDNLSLPIGVNSVNPELLGPGREHSELLALADNNSLYDGGPTVPRNAPTTFNTGLLDQVMFHDGRVESIGKTVGFNGSDGLGIITPDSPLDDLDNPLADPDAGDNLPTAQSRFPVTSPEEMRGFTFATPGTNDDVRTALEVKLASVQSWLDEFAAVYGDSTITYERIAEAIGEYERSQIFINTPWKAFLEGDDTAISDAARRGALLFMLPTRVDGASCVSCHRGDRFTDEQFHVLGVPQIGRGKGDGDTGTDDFGRNRVSGNDNDLYAFRTPSLLNVTETGPWGHSGAYTTLESIVRHHLDPQAAFDNYDTTQLEPSIVDSGQTADMQINTQKALDTLAANRLAGISSIQNVELTDDQISDLVEFLKTLTDPCVTDRSCLTPWIPDSDYIDANPDLQLLKAVDAGLNPL